MKYVALIFQFIFACQMLLATRDANVALTVSSAALFIVASIYQVRG